MSFDKNKYEASSETGYFHVIYTLKYSRYEEEKIIKKKPAGFIARTYPFLEGTEEEILVETVCNVADALGLKIIALNFCGDHVHSMLSCSPEYLPEIMMLWKGKISYLFNRWINKTIDLQPSIDSKGTKQQLWSKSYYQKKINSGKQFQNTIDYIKNNRIKHGLKDLSENFTKRIEKTILKRID
ncbi:MAG: transposase [Bacteroidales bacterium]|jgi:REP element-mobilizing transposase RayT|nr:transposase [Bacteroidales bacterium]